MSHFTTTTTRPPPPTRREPAPVLLHLAAYLFAGMILHRVTTLAVSEPAGKYAALGMAIAAAATLALRHFPAALNGVKLLAVGGGMVLIYHYAGQVKPVPIVLLEWALMALLAAIALGATGTRDYAMMGLSSLGLIVSIVRRMGAAPETLILPLAIYGLAYGIALQGSAPPEIPSAGPRRLIPWQGLCFRLAVVLGVAWAGGTQLARSLPLPMPKSEVTRNWMWLTYLRSNLGLQPEERPVPPLAPGELARTAAQLRRTATIDLGLDLTQSHPDRLSRRLLYVVDCEQPVYLRTAVYDHYTGLAWGPSMKVELTALNEGRQGTQVTLPERLPTVAGAARTECRIWPQDKLGHQVAVPVLTRMLERGSLGLLFADPLGNVYSASQVQRGTNYACQLAAFDYPSITGQRIGNDDEKLAEQYLQLPPISARLLERCQQAVKGEMNRLEAVHKLMAMVQQEKTYSLAPIALPAGVSESTEYFLFEMKRGACAQFASALAVACRAVGIPARLAVGYGPGNYRSATMHYEVREKDAHAWTQVWFAEVGWVDFDGTPGGLLLEAPPPPPPPEATRTDLEQILQAAQFKWLSAQTRATVWMQDAWLWAAARWWWAVGAVAIAALAMLAWWLGKWAGRRLWWWRRWQRAPRLAPRLATEELYQCALEKLKRAGIRFEPSSTPTEIADLATAGNYPWAADWEVLTVLAERHVFGPHEPSAEAVTELRDRLGALLKRLPERPPVEPQPVPATPSPA